MTPRRETAFWLLLALAGVVASLIILQLTTRLAFVTADQADLNAVALEARLANYGVDDADPRRAALDPGLADEAAAENSQLRQADEARSDLNLAAAGAPFSLSALLFASPTPVPTELIRLPATATHSPSATSGAVDTALPRPRVTAAASATITWTATVTSLPTSSPVASATLRAVTATGVTTQVVRTETSIPSSNTPLLPARTRAPGATPTASPTRKVGLAGPALAGRVS